MKTTYSVYLLRCADGSLYCGIAKDVVRRVAAHNAGKGAKYTRGRRPVILVRVECGYTLPGALSRENEIKKLSKVQKEELVKP
jgi:predicted GIY-YIG superfamily endonuclease